MPNDRSVQIDDDTYYTLRDLSEEIEDRLDNGEFSMEAEDADLALLDRAAGVLREIMWRYEDSQEIEPEKGDDA